MIGERPNKKNIESLNLTRKVNLLRLRRGNYFAPISFSPISKDLFIISTYKQNLDVSER